MALRRSTRLLKDAAASIDLASLPPRPSQKRGQKRPAAAASDDDQCQPGPSPRVQAVAGKPKKTSSAPSGPTRAKELALIAKGFQRIVGVDEAGRGPLAGPVVAAAVWLPSDLFIEGVDDSKKINCEEDRESIYEQLVSNPLVRYGVCVVDREVIDEVNILQAALQAMEGAVEALPEDAKPDYILVDGNKRPKKFDPATSEPVIKGDASCYPIACASIIAKVTRDRIMHELDRQVGGKYGWAQNKGYPTADHVAKIHEHGISEFHRRTFNPIKSMLAKANGAAGEEETEEKVAKKLKKGQ